MADRLEQMKRTMGSGHGKHGATKDEEVVNALAHSVATDLRDSGGAVSIVC